MARPRARLASASAALTVAAASAWAAGPAGAVHESHHSDVFQGRTSQAQRLVLRVKSHTSIGIRFRWRGSCESGTALRIARFRNVAVDAQGRFFRRSRSGVGVRGKIGFNPMGDPVFPEPFSFANNEAKGRLRAVVNLPGKGLCRSGTVTWAASR